MHFPRSMISASTDQLIRNESSTRHPAVNSNHTSRFVYKYSVQLLMLICLAFLNEDDIGERGEGREGRKEGGIRSIATMYCASRLHIFDNEKRNAVTSNPSPSPARHFAISKRRWCVPGSKAVGRKTFYVNVTEWLSMFTERGRVEVEKEVLWTCRKITAQLGKKSQGKAGILRSKLGITVRSLSTYKLHTQKFANSTKWFFQ